MTTLMKTASLTTLILLLSGCSNLTNNLNTPVKPKVDDTIQVIQDNSIKSISDITSIAFEWRKVDDPRVVGYNFYRANMHKDGRRLKLIKSLNNRYTTHFVDKDLEPNTKYVYQISSKAKNGFESKTTNAFSAQTLDRAVPVSFLQAISDLPNRIKLVWRPHQDQRIAYYKIEKLNATLNEWVTLKTIKGRLESEYIDERLDNNESFKYKITAFTYEDVATKASQVVTAKTKALPLAVQNLKITNNLPNKINLTWDPSPSQDVLKYIVYRSPIKAFGYKRLKEVISTNLYFEDTINNSGKVYYYKVLSLDRDNLESSSKIDAIKGQTLNNPSKPNITLAQLQNSKAILNWTAGDSRAMSYTVYKRTRINFFEYKTEKFENITDTRFEDNNIVSGIEYKYSIQANDEYGLMSDKTDEAELILPKTKIQ